MTIYNDYLSQVCELKARHKREFDALERDLKLKQNECPHGAWEYQNAMFYALGETCPGKRCLECGQQLRISAGTFEYYDDCQSAIKFLESQLTGAGTGNTTVTLVSAVRVTYYGNQVPVAQLGFVTKEDGWIRVKVYDDSIDGLVAASLKKTLFNAYVFSKGVVRVDIPKPTLDEKNKLIKQIKGLGEETRIAIRNIRRRAKKYTDQKDLVNITDKVMKEVDDVINRTINKL